jgi:UDP-N-acetylmuramate dehydrogenase
MLGEIRGEVRFKEPMAYHTGLRCGGPADIFVLPQHVEDVRHAVRYADKEKLPFRVLGGGNNLLVRDRGVRGVVVKLDGSLGRMEFHGDEVTVGAGATLSTIVRDAATRGLGGLDCLVGIPATIGGALAMNAGTPEGAIAEMVSAVYLLYPDGSLGEIRPRPASFGDRHLDFPPASILLAARLHLRRKPPAEIQADIRTRLKQRKTCYPVVHAAAGLAWKHPSPDQAAKLVEKAGLKGKRVGGAEVWAKHPNFIVNRRGATAADVLALLDLVTRRVADRTGQELRPEITVIGE